MSRPSITVLAPVGAALMLIFTSLSVFNVMAQIAESMTPVGEAATAPGTTLVGLIGILLFGLGMFNATILRRRQTFRTRALFVAAAITLAISVCLIGLGNWHLNHAFYTLATAESVDPVSFSEEAHRGRMPLLIGYTLVVVSAILVCCGAVLLSPETTQRRSPMITILAAVSVLALVLAGFWSWVSIPSFYELMASDPVVEPSQLANSVLGAIRSVFLSLIGIAGFALTTLWLAFAKPISEDN